MKIRKIITTLKYIILIVFAAVLLLFFLSVFNIIKCKIEFELAITCVILALVISFYVYIKIIINLFKINKTVRNKRIKKFILLAVLFTCMNGVLHIILKDNKDIDYRLTSSIPLAFGISFIDLIYKDKDELNHTTK